MTASRPDTALPIDVHGELLFRGPSNCRVALRAEGSVLQLAVPGWSQLNELGPRSVRAKRSTLATTISALKVLRLTVDVNVDGQRAFGLGEGVKTTFLARVLGLTSTDIRFSTVVSLVRSRARKRRADRR